MVYVAGVGYVVDGWGIVYLLLAGAFAALYWDHFQEKTMPISVFVVVVLILITVTLHFLVSHVRFV